MKQKQHRFHGVTEGAPVKYASLFTLVVVGVGVGVLVVVGVLVIVIVVVMEFKSELQNHGKTEAKSPDTEDWMPCHSGL